MNESRRVEINLHAGTGNLAQIGSAGQLDKLGIAVHRNYQAHVDAALCRRFQGEQYRLGGDEVGCFDVNVLACTHYHAQITLHNLRIRRDGAAGDYLCEAVVGCGRYVVGVVFAVGDECAVYEKPVFQKHALQGIDPAAGDFGHRIAPRLTARSLHIPLRYVHSADETFRSVYHDNLAVVAVVDLARERGEAHRQERMHLDALAAHALEERLRHVPAPHIVVYQAHLHPLAGLGYEGVGNEAAQRVVGKDVDVDVYVVSGPGDGCEQGCEVAVAVGVDVDAVVLERQ